jgi:hypothetical protein
MPGGEVSSMVVDPVPVGLTPCPMIVWSQFKPSELAFGSLHAEASQALRALRFCESRRV